MLKSMQTIRNIDKNGLAILERAQSNDSITDKNTVQVMAYNSKEESFQIALNYKEMPKKQRYLLILKLINKANA